MTVCWLGKMEYKSEVWYKKDSMRVFQFTTFYRFSKCCYIKFTLNVCSLHVFAKNEFQNLVLDLITCITDMIRFYVNSQFLWRYLKNKTHMKSKSIPVHWKSKDNDYFTYVFKSRKRVQHNYHTYDADFWSFSEEKKEDTIAWKKSFWLEYYLKGNYFQNTCFQGND